VRLKATFPNDDGALFPNQFVNARLLLEVKRGTLLVPSAAIQRGPEGPFVFVVKEDKSVSVRAVTVGVVHSEETSIDKGLSANDLVVIDGTEKLREGTKVDVRAARDLHERGTDQPPQGPAPPRQGTGL
jgi:multidrug efflux system membrane fusion protein